MKIIKMTITLCCALVVLALGFSLYYYLDSKDYLKGENQHYLGTSELTADQVVMVGTKRSIGGEYSSLRNLEILENGLIKVEYDFYSDESYVFLDVAKFSYLDTPLANMLLEAKFAILIFIGGLAVIGSVIGLVGRYSSRISDTGKRKIAHASWYLLHPKHLKKHSEAQSIYNSKVQADIIIDLHETGILCVRTWKYKDGYLYSAGIGQACWETKTLFANKNPEEANENGVYAFRLGVVERDWGFMKDVIGIVSLKGEWCEHADGVLRAERCDILHLIVGEYYRPVAGKLSSHYGFPVTVATNPINEYLNWLLKKNGFNSMVHNSKIMEGSHDHSRESNKKRAHTS